MNAHPPPEGWKHLSERARWELAHPDQSSPLLATSNLVLQLRLWSYPRRGAQVSWGLSCPFGGMPRRGSANRAGMSPRTADA